MTTTTARRRRPTIPRTRLIATSAGATTVAPPGRAARERGRPALCANVLDEFVRALLPRSTSRRGGPARGLHAPPGPNGLLQGRHVPPALLPPHRPLYPACRFPLSPQLIRSCSRLVSYLVLLTAGRRRVSEIGRHQRSFSPEIRNDLTRDAQHVERGSVSYTHLTLPTMIGV